MGEIKVVCSASTLEKVHNLLNTTDKNSCILYSEGRSIIWCGSDGECAEIAMMRDMHRRHDEQMALADKLEKEGHTCIMDLESYPVQIRWCNKTPCAHSAH